jgi:RNA polymerase sigma-70 factor (ECF subfamily)
MPLGDDRDEFTQFCDEVSPRLYGALVLQLGDRATAEDLTQEALARAWEKWKKVRSMDHREGWVFRVGFNLAASAGRRTRIARRVVRQLREPENERPGDPGDRLVIADALESIADRQRQAVVLRHYAGFSVAETASAMDCAEGTVKALTSQGLDRLRAVLAPADPVDRDV